MRNPLIKRIPKELVSEWRKYLVIIIFMVVMIGVVSGMYVGHDSMLDSVYKGKDDLMLEDGSFELSVEATDDVLKDISEGKGVEKDAVKLEIYKNYYIDAEEDKDNDGTKDATVRLFKSDSEIDKASFNEGRAPKIASEIAIDRMHADNVGLEIGDTITVEGREFKIVGLLSYVNYLTLHQSNTDLMFDAFGFDVAMVTPEGFDSVDARVHYSYAYKYVDEPKDKIEEADYADSVLKALVAQAYVHKYEIKDYLPEYLRQASNFAPSDIEGDTAGAAILCYILIGVIAFIFAVTISNTIDKESAVIGTLRASGYSKAELTVHYMSMPVIVTILGAILGNVLGYTAFKNMFVDLYYQSYSLPKLKLVISVTALIKTTIIPLLLMFFINLFVIVKKLQLSPLRFLRHDLSKSKRTKARRIPKWSFLGRFRLRNFFQNIPNYVILVFGVVFIELMMCFAFGLPDSLNHYGDKAADMMFTEYQYVLMSNKDSQGNIIETSKEGAEKFGMKDLNYDRADSSFRSGMGSGGDESVSVYGITEGSEYIKFDKAPGRGEAYVSSAYAAKYGIKKGDTISLHEEYEDKSYSFKIVGEVDYDGGIALFMELKEFNKTFGYDEDYFMGYFSHSEIEDIDKQYIATVITKDVVLRVTNQLMHSMGGMMDVFKYALIVLAAALIYLLTKIIIEKNEHSISMTKILGFKNTEIASLYMVPTAVVVLLCIGVSFIAGYYLMIWLFKIFMLQMDGYFAFYMRPVSMILSMLYVLVGYFVVTVIDFFRIKKIPMDIALKNVE